MTNVRSIRVIYSVNVVLLNTCYYQKSNEMPSLRNIRTQVDAEMAVESAPHSQGMSGMTLNLVQFHVTAIQ